ncbi:MAG TPA: D-glycero-beta-D-manno-heptose 1-phosphate adenylyltransferase, partial [Dehalococcoidia bacterium]|nr:D-glycero-beta-D-manno-heptose 1-phosphate adenylyltransferase [Dehalococcoidia bacterium]
TGVTEAAGGAANVAVNVAALGANVTFVSLIGDDAEGTKLADCLASAGVSARGIEVVHGRRTLAKQRVISGTHLVVRLDQGDTMAPENDVQSRLVAHIEAAYAASDAVIVSDYAYGVLSPAAISALERLHTASPKPVFVDAKDLARYRCLRPAVVKPNYAEAVSMAGSPAVDSSVERIRQVTGLATTILDVTGAESAAVTLDIDGAIILRRDDTPYLVNTEPLKGARGAGAGDSFMAALAVATVAGLDYRAASTFAAAAAALAVGNEGTAVCSQSILGAHFSTGQTLDEPSRTFESLAELRRQGRRIVFTNGCFDIVHSGHTAFLHAARALGDILVVGLNSDDSVTRLKGIGRPVNRLSDRAKVLSALDSVDFVLAFEEDTPASLIERIRPDVFVKGGDYRREELPEAPLVESLGGVVRILDYVEDHSTTAIIERIAMNEARHG